LPLSPSGAVFGSPLPPLRLPFSPPFRFVPPSSSFRSFCTALLPPFTFNHAGFHPKPGTHPFFSPSRQCRFLSFSSPRNPIPFGSRATPLSFLNARTLPQPLVQFSLFFLRRGGPPPFCHFCLPELMRTAPSWSSFYFFLFLFCPQASFPLRLFFKKVDSPPPFGPLSESLSEQNHPSCRSVPLFTCSLTRPCVFLFPFCALRFPVTFPISLFPLPPLPSFFWSLYLSLYQRGWLLFLLFFPFFLLPSFHIRCVPLCRLRAPLFPPSCLEISPPHF